MALFAVLGTIPVFLNPDILSATTVSGTMVLGLAPIFVFWKRKSNAIAFLLSIATGVVFGVILATKNWPSSLNFTEGKYADLLAVNCYGTLVSFALYLLASSFTNQERKGP